MNGKPRLWMIACHGVDPRATDIDVEDCNVEIGGLCQLKGVRNIGSLAGHGVAQFLYHSRDHHSDKGFILNQ